MIWFHLVRCISRCAQGGLPPIDTKEPQKQIMKFSTLHFCQSAFLWLALNCLVPQYSWSQCDGLQVNHLSGVAQVGCTEVTVTSQGSVGNLFECNEGPYWIGPTATGSYTFEFSPPIAGVKFDISSINYLFGQWEEVAFYINGSFYPLTDPGQADTDCQVSDAEVTAGGRLGACYICVANCDDLTITENISSITVEDIHLYGSPLGVIFSMFICCPTCDSDAGRIINDPLHICPGTVATVAPATQTFLENGDLLQYILFSNPSDTLGSILATSASPSFAFNPAIMQESTPYYIAAIVGNNVNGNVDLADPCLSISNGISVMWHPLPTVAFSVANPDVCAGACTDVTATFTGTAPFTLTYTMAGAGPLTQTFSGSNGTFSVCSAIGAPPGSFLLQALSVNDGFCICD